MSEIKSYEDLVAWQKAYALVLEVYKATQTFPADERFGLTQQMRRAAVSVPSNIAEGWGRQTTADYIRFLRMARGSLYEIKTQMRIAIDLGFHVSGKQGLIEMVGEAERVLNGLIRALEQRTGDK